MYAEGKESVAPTPNGSFLALGADYKVRGENEGGFLLKK